MDNQLQGWIYIYSIYGPGTTRQRPSSDSDPASILSELTEIFGLLIETAFPDKNSQKYAETFAPDKKLCPVSCINRINAIVNKKK